MRGRSSLAGRALDTASAPGWGPGGHGISVPLQAPGTGRGLEPSSQPQRAGVRFAVCWAGLWAASAVPSALFQGLQAEWDSKGWMPSHPKALHCLSPRTD